VLSLYHESTSDIGSLSTSAETVTTTQVRLISVSNTLSRLISGPLADFISPLTSHRPGDRPTSRKYRISRVVLLSGTSLLLTGTFVYLDLAIRTPDDLWILRYAALILSCSSLIRRFIQCCYRCCLWDYIHNFVCHSSTCSLFISLIAPALVQTQHCILRLGEKRLWAQLWSDILRTPFRDTSLFIPLCVCLGAPQCWWWCLYWRHMLEPHVLGVRWRVPSVFCRNHPPWEAMEGTSLSDSTH
jgi:hypothetical protein